jgi:basic membrane protein A and related proteins
MSEKDVAKKDVTRRSYLKYAAGVATAVVAGAAGYALGTSTVPSPPAAATTVTETLTQAVTQAAAAKGIDPKDLKFAGMTDSLRDDNSWGTMVWQAHQKLEKIYGCKTALTEGMTNYGDIEKIYRDYLTEGYHFVIWWGFQGSEGAMKAGPDFPKQQLAYTCVPQNVANTAAFVLMEEAPGFVSGMLGGFLTKTNKVGAFCGTESPCGQAYVNGFEAGAKQVNPKVQVMKAFAGAWTDPAVGKEAALTMIDAGADFLGKYCASTDLGAMAACKDRNVGTTGILCPQSFMCPDQDYIDFVFDYMADGAPVRQAIDNMIAGNAPLGRQYPLGLAPMFGATITPIYNDPFKKLPADTQATIKSVLDQCLAGTYVPMRSQALTWH